MENGEMLMKGQGETDESGYSEKKLDQNVDLQAGQWLDLQQGSTQTSKNKQQTVKKSQNKEPKTNQKQGGIKAKPPIQSSHTVSGTIMKQDEKLVQAVDRINAELQSTIDVYLKILVEDIDKAEDVLRGIIDLQGTQKSLLQALKWEAKGDLDISKLPKQVQNLLK